MTEFGSTGDGFSRQPSLVDNFHMVPLPLPPDIRIGVHDITRAIVGRDDEPAVRSMFHVLATSNTIPFFKIGSRNAVRMSTVRAKIWSQERRAFASAESELLAKMHVLISAAAPLMTRLCHGAADEKQHVELTLILAEAGAVIERLLNS
jgi:hypothetical protein